MQGPLRKVKTRRLDRADGHMVMATPAGMRPVHGATLCHVSVSHGGAADATPGDARRRRARSRLDKPRHSGRSRAGSAQIHALSLRLSSLKGKPRRHRVAVAV
eukprot:5267454-Prymnesium_polylepis.1